MQSEQLNQYAGESRNTGMNFFAEQYKELKEYGTKTTAVMELGLIKIMGKKDLLKWELQKEGDFVSFRKQQFDETLDMVGKFAADLSFPKQVLAVESAKLMETNWVTALLQQVSKNPGQREVSKSEMLSMWLIDFDVRVDDLLFGNDDKFTKLREAQLELAMVHFEELTGKSVTRDCEGLHPDLKTNT